MMSCCAVTLKPPLLLAIRLMEINGDLSNNFKPPNVEVHEKRVQGLAKAVEESQRNANQVRLQMIFQ
jgi:hypothetical protein